MTEAELDNLIRRPGFAEHPTRPEGDIAVQPRMETITTNPNEYRPRHNYAPELVERIAKELYERYARPGRPVNREWDQIGDRDHWIRLVDFTLEAIEIHQR